jgi:hypothetical protein
MKNTLRTRLDRDLHDAAFAAMLKDAYRDEPALIEDDTRTERVLRYMQTSLHERHDRLEDPALTALLTDAYANDPALVEAPGRTERIMRAVLGSGAQSRRVPLSRLVFAYTAGAVAILAVALTLTVMRPWPSPQPLIDAKVPQHIEQAPIKPPTIKPVQTVNTRVTTPGKTTTPVVVSHPRQNDEKRHVSVPPQQEQQNPPPPTHSEHQDTPPVMTPLPVIEDNSADVTLAAFHYEAADAAAATGDHETAAEHYWLAYQADPANPNPDAVMSCAMEYSIAVSSLPVVREGGIT